MRDIFSHLHYSPSHKLVYANNQKAGCTTVKYSLWQDHDRRTGEQTFSGRTHDKTGSPFQIGGEALRAVGWEALAAAHCFCLVRNPYTRALSAYLHHVADDRFFVRLTRRLGLWRSEKMRDHFMRKVGLPAAQSLSFLDYLVALDRTGAQHFLGHFRRQTENIAWSDIAYSSVFHLEDMATLEHFLRSRDIDMQSRLLHAQKADIVTDHYYGTEEQQLVRKIYAADFEAFGYGSERCAGGPTGAVSYSASARPLADLIREGC